MIKKGLHNDMETSTKIQQIAFSDYDGTLVRDGQVDADTLAAIDSWRAKGNAFGIATGRGFAAIQPELERLHIPVDYLVCTNGSAVYRADGALLQCTEIPEEDFQTLCDSKFLRDYQDGILFFTRHHAYCYRNAQQLPPNLFEKLNSFDEVKELHHVMQVGTHYASQQEARDAFTAIDAAYPQVFTGNVNRSFLDMNAWGMSKDIGIMQLVEFLHIDVKKVHVIGDDCNDLPMIQRFHGCCVDSAAEDIQKASINVFPTVGKMLRHYQE